MDFDIGEIFKILLGLLILFGGPLLRALTKGRKKAPALTEPLPEPAYTPQEDDFLVEERVPDETKPSQLDILRQTYNNRRQQALGQTRQMQQQFVRERPNYRLLETVNTYIPKQLADAEQDLNSPNAPQVEDGAYRVEHVELVLTIVEHLGEQRRDPDLAALLGDADRLAEACYRPVLTFAQSEGLPVTSNHPVVLLSHMDLGIATGLIPTSLAPIFLPRDFFTTTAWWPGLPHEIGHDFFASVGGFESSLRSDLQLPPASSTQRFGDTQRGLSLSEVEALFGIWLEELFCDVFATMMTGPAYISTMNDLFAVPNDPMLVLTAPLDRESGGYAAHPPRHLRVMLSCKILESMGFSKQAQALLEEWNGVHQVDGKAPDFLVVPTRTGPVGLDLQPFLTIAYRIAEKLYRGPLTALRHRGLQSVAGLDYGPHRHNEAERASRDLLSGQVPAVRDPRAVVAGAVFAGRAEPERDSEFVDLARAAIPAMGTFETRADAYAIREQDTTLSPGAEDIIGALVMREVLDRPRSLRNTRRLLG